jgi:hypothetical protein
MSINFPDTPFAGLTYSHGNSVWEWNGSSWILYASNVRLPENFTSIPNTFTAIQRFSQGITASGGTFASIEIISSATNVSPFVLTASSLVDGVGILRLSGPEPDINLNDTDGGFNTLTFENAGNPRVAIGRNNTNAFYLAVRDPVISGGAWKDDVIVANSSTGVVSLGRGLCASGGVTFSGPVEFDSVARFDAGLCAGSGVTFSNGFGATGNIFLHGAQLESREGNAPKFFTRAWVTFDGQGTGRGAIRTNGSGNVSSITLNAGAGDFTINFITPLPTANYSVTTSCISYAAANNSVNVRVLGANNTLPTLKTTSACRISAANATVKYDMEEIYFTAVC